MFYFRRIFPVLPVLFLPLLSLAAAAFHLTAEPEEPSAQAGALFRVIVESDSRLDGELTLPKLNNGTWVRNISSRSVRIINGSATYTYILSLLPAKEGTLEIGAISGTSRGKSASSRPFSVKVLPKSVKKTSADGKEESFPLSKVVFGRITTPRKSYCCGEEIPLNLELFVLRQFAERVRLSSYPELSGLKEAVFADRSADHPDSRRANHRFGPPKESMRVDDGSTFAVITFPCSFRMLKPGEWKPGAKIPLGIAMPRRRSGSPFDDDFFDSFFSGGMDPVQNFTIPFTFDGKITVTPLPEPPAGVAPSGLVGVWNFTARLSRPAAKVGEVVELILAGQGNASPDLAEPPRLEIPGFRIYPPETVRGKNKVEFKYALIPLDPGEKSFSVRLCWYDPEQKKYQEKSFSFTLPVARGENPPAAPPVVPQLKKERNPEPEPTAPAAPREEIFYQKSAVGTPVKVPLFFNALPGILLCLGAGVLFAGISVWRRSREENLSAHPELQRRRERRMLLPRLQREWHQADNSRDYLRSAVLPHLAEALGLPPGATPGEVSGKLTDPELKQLFAELESSGFRPDSADMGAVPEKTAKKLFRLLRRLSLFFCIFAFILPLSATPLNAEFDKGNFREALAHYKSLLRPGEISAPLCYNIGGAYYRLDDLPEARVWFTRARLLAPRDAEALENLNLVNRRLLQNEEASAGTPHALLLCLRDHFRPDEYLVFAAAMVMFLLILYGARRRVSFGWKTGLSAAAGLLLLFALAAAAFQAAGPYSRCRAVVLGKTLALRSLPAAGTGRIEANLPGGSDALIVEERGGWIRIQSNGQDGWVPAGSVEAVFPYGIL